MLFKRLRKSLHMPTPAQIAAWILVFMGVSIIGAPGVTVQYMTANHSNFYNGTVIGFACVIGGVTLAFSRKGVTALWLCNLPLIGQALSTVQYALETRQAVQGSLIYVGYLLVTLSYVYHSSLTDRDDNRRL